mgnify:CR=1 FL=1
MKSRGISEIVSYVLLVSIAVAISALVYAFLRLYIPKAQPECPDGISLAITNAECTSGVLSLNVQNTGRYKVSAAYVRLGDIGREFKNWINDPTTYLGGAGYILSPGQYLGPKTDSKYTAIDYVRDISIGQGGKPRPVSEYMDPQHNLIVATLFVCLPGVIYGLDKWRQIQCLYADCLQNAVGKEGLPVTACEDQKAYAKCKYITGELFAVFPWTAVIDHFLKIIKNALSNPFSALGVAVALACPTACYFRDDSGFAYQACRGARLLTLIGDAAQNVQSIIQEGFTIRTDYCKRLEND